MKSSELMKLAEEGKIEKGRIVVDQNGTEFVFTGISFQLLDPEKVYANNVVERFVFRHFVKKYYGLGIKDNWTVTDYIEE